MMPTIASIHVSRAEWNETISGPQSAVSRPSQDTYRPVSDAPLFMAMAAGCGLGIWASGPAGCALGTLALSLLGCDSDFRLQAEPTPEVTPPSPPDPEKCEEVTITVDCDGDGFTNTFSVCEDDAWVVASACGGQTSPSDEEDCVPQNPEAYPGAPEIACSGADENCDGKGDQEWIALDSVSPSASLSASETQSDPDAAPYFGEAISTGDLNGDGENDLVVGSVGRVHLFYGPVVSDTKEDVTMILPELAPYNPMLPIFDFNGDGYDDLAVSASEDIYQDEGTTIFIIEGPLPSGTAGIDVEQYSALIFVNSHWITDISAVGDLNFDKRDDLVLIADEGYSSSSSILYGRDFPSEPTTVTISEDPDATRLNSDSLADSYSIERDFWLFTTVTAAGDFNDDGYPDILITGGMESYDHDDEQYVWLAAAHLLYGPFSMGFEHILDESNTGIFELEIAEDDDDLTSNFGESLAGLGDINGDGFDDVMIGLSEADAGGGPGADAGLAYLLLGASNLHGVHQLHDMAVTLVPPTDAEDPEKTTGGFATILAPVGDVNGDFLADAAIYVSNMAETDCLPEGSSPGFGLIVLYGLPFFAEEMRGQSRSVEDLAGTVYDDALSFNPLIHTRISPRENTENPGVFDGNPSSLIFPVIEYPHHLPYQIKVFNNVNP